MPFPEYRADSLVRTQANASQQRLVTDFLSGYGGWWAERKETPSVVWEKGMRGIRDKHSREDALRCCRQPLVKEESVTRQGKHGSVHLDRAQVRLEFPKHLPAISSGEQLNWAWSLLGRDFPLKHAANIHRKHHLLNKRSTLHFWQVTSAVACVSVVHM